MTRPTASHQRMPSVLAGRRGPMALHGELLLTTAVHLIMVLAGVCLIGGTACANPGGGTVVSGSATITETAPGRLDVRQGTDKAIIDWRSFSIGQGEHTNFQQPSAGSIALNRVTGADPSAILGRMIANGQVFLVNPNGIMVGQGARIDVGGLVATTANIRNEDFMASRYRFDQPSANPDARVVNRGDITVGGQGLAALAAPGVENAGSITAELGEVVLAGIRTFTLDAHGDGLLSFQVGEPVTVAPRDAQGKPIEALVSNSGKISAPGGTVVLTAGSLGGVVDRVINMDGVVEARAVEVKGGTIVLSGGDAGIVNVTGALDASGQGPNQTGGTVKVLGDKVALTKQARIDVSGDAGGGTTLIGGNRHGDGPEPNARRTLIARDATIKADAKTRGNGGTVVAWADDSLSFAGAISVRGGAAEGDGGFVETSSRKGLFVTSGRVDGEAPAGKSGLWLLDPENIIVTNSGTDDLTLVDEFLDDADGDYGGFGTAFIYGGALEQASSDVVLQALNDIAVEANLFMNGGVTNPPGPVGLVLQAGNNITINSRIVTNGGRIHLEADSSHSPIGPADGAGTVAIRSPTGEENAGIDSASGPITLIGADFDIAGDVIADRRVEGILEVDGDFVLARSQNGAALSIGGAEDILNAGEVGLISANGRFTVGRATTAGTDGRGTAPVDLTTGQITFNGPLLSESAGSNASPVTIVSSAGILFNTGLSLPGKPITLEAAGPVIAGSALEGPAIRTGGGALTITSGVEPLGSYSLRGPLGTTGEASSFTVDTAGGAIRLFDAAGTVSTKLFDSASEAPVNIAGNASRVGFFTRTDTTLDASSFGTLEGVVDGALSVNGQITGDLVSLFATGPLSVNAPIAATSAINLAAGIDGGVRAPVPPQPLTLAADITAGTVRMTATEAVSQPAGTLTADSLSVSAGTSITLPSVLADVFAAGFESGDDGVVRSLSAIFGRPVAIGTVAGFLPTLFSGVAGFDLVDGVTTRNGSASLSASGQLSVNRPILAGTGAIDLTVTGPPPGTDVPSLVFGADVVGAGIGLDAAGAIAQTAGTLQTAGLAVTAAGDVTLDQPNGVGVLALSAPDRSVVFRNASPLAIGAAGEVSGLSAGQAVIRSGEAMTFSDVPITIGQSLSVVAGTDIFASSGTTIVAGTPTAAGSGRLVFQAAGNIDLQGSVTTRGGAVTVEADSPHVGGGSDGAGTLTLGGRISSDSGRITLIGAGFSLPSTADAGTGSIDLAPTTTAAPLAFSIGGGLLTDGTLTIGQATTAGIQPEGTGAITLTANGLSIQDAITTGTDRLTAVSLRSLADIAIDGPIGAAGNAAATAGGSVVFSATGALTSQTRSVTVQADADGNGTGGVVMANGAAIRATGGPIVVAAAQDLTITGLTSGSTTPDAVTLVSRAGAIIDGGDTALDVEASSGGLVARVGTGIGAGNPLDVRIGRIDLENTGSSAIAIAEADDLTVGRLAGVSGSPLALQAGGTLTFAGATALSGPTTLTAGTGVTFNGTLDGSQPLTVSTGGDIRFTGDVGATSPLGNVVVGLPSVGFDILDPAIRDPARIAGPAGLVGNQGGNVVIGGRFVAGGAIMRIDRIAGEITGPAVPTNAFDVAALFVDARRVTLFGTVQAQSGVAAAALAATPIPPLNPAARLEDFTINGCIIGQVCEQPKVPVVVDGVDVASIVTAPNALLVTPSPQVPSIEAESLFLATPPQSSLQQPEEPFSNLGNEELW
ncbi:filamentous hemagglutinin family protein [Skermanella aerolata]|uniref:beta strand repeat-containing protein n=1 Tax=Skermanella aerolata TaxID=393310 RepID=UPI003D1EBF58